jgi:hypothetical protein
MRKAKYDDATFNIDLRAIEDATIESCVYTQPCYQHQTGDISLLEKQLHKAKLDFLFCRIAWHSTSQHGEDFFIIALQDNAKLNELFDWNATSEGWRFWKRVTKRLNAVEVQDASEKL